MRCFNISDAKLWVSLNLELMFDTTVHLKLSGQIFSASGSCSVQLMEGLCKSGQNNEFVDSRTIFGISIQKWLRSNMVGRYLLG